MKASLTASSCFIALSAAGVLKTNTSTVPDVKLEEPYRLHEKGHPLEADSATMHVSRHEHKNYHRAKGPEGEAEPEFIVELQGMLFKMPRPEGEGGEGGEGEKMPGEGGEGGEGEKMPGEGGEGGEGEKMPGGGGEGGEGEKMPGEGGEGGEGDKMPVGGGEGGEGEKMPEQGGEGEGSGKRGEMIP